MRNDLTNGFVFVDAGRTYTCSVEESRQELWWWFQVSNDRSPQRYAPFRHDSKDTMANVQSRIVTYYEELLVRRAAPPTTDWSRRGRPPAKKPIVADPDIVEPVAPEAAAE